MSKAGYEKIEGDARPVAKKIDAGAYGQNVVLMSVFSATFALIVAMFVVTLMQTSPYSDIDTSMPEEVMLNGFKAGSLTFEEQIFTCDEGIVFESDTGVVRMGMIETSGDVVALKGSLESKEIEMFSALTLNSDMIEGSQGSSVNMHVNGTLRVAGCLIAEKLVWSNYVIEDGKLSCLEEKETTARLLEDSDIEMFRVSDGSLAIATKTGVVVCAMDERRGEAVKVWEAELFGITEIRSDKGVFHFFGRDSELTVTCKNGRCEECDTELGKGSEGESIVDGFGLLWELEQDGCAIRQCDGGKCSKYVLGSNCEGAGVSLTKELEVVVALPRQNLVKVWDGDAGEFEDIKVPFGGNVWQLVPHRSTLLILDEGELKDVKF